LIETDSSVVMSLLIACDGSCLGNGTSENQPMGWAWADEKGNWLSNGFYKGSNNKAELLAIWSVLKFHPKGDITVQMDSQYALNVVDKWAFGWEKNGWIKADKKPVLNREIIEEILILRKQRTDPIRFQWVKAHVKNSTTPLNVKADELAYAASNRAKNATNLETSLGLYLDSKGRTHMPQEEAMLRKVFN
jgi:ribonuclease HI